MVEPEIKGGNPDKRQGEGPLHTMVSNPGVKEPFFIFKKRYLLQKTGKASGSASRFNSGIGSRITHNACYTPPRF